MFKKIPPNEKGILRTLSSSSSASTRSTGTEMSCVSRIVALHCSCVYCGVFRFRRTFTTTTVVLTQDDDDDAPSEAPPPEAPPPEAPPPPPSETRTRRRYRTSASAPRSYRSVTRPDSGWMAKNVGAWSSPISEYVSFENGVSAGSLRKGQDQRLRSKWTRCELSSFRTKSRF
jgi:hypothetical protein